MPRATGPKGQRLGWVQRRQGPVASGRWALGADADALERRRPLRASPRQGPAPRSPQALPTPQRRARPPPPRGLCHDSAHHEPSNQYGRRLPRRPPWRPGPNNADNEPSTETWQATPERTAAGHWPARKAGAPNGGSAPWHQLPPGAQH